MTATDPYTALRPDLTGRPPLDDGPLFPPGHPDAPPTVQPTPPGMVWTLLPDGSRALAYLPPGYEKTEQAAAPTGPAGERDKWPLRMLTGGASTAMVLGVVGHYGPGLSQAGHAAEMAGIGVAASAAGLGALIALVKGGTARQSGARVDVRVQVNNTVHGGNATANSKSRAR